MRYLLNQSWKKIKLSLNPETGMSFVELVLVVAAVAFLALLVANIPASISAIGKSRNSSIAKDIVSKQIDYLRKQTYDNLSNGTASFNDSVLSSLPESSGEYEISDCPVEICTNTEPVRQVKVRVRWTELGDTNQGSPDKILEVTTLIGSGGVAQ